MSASQSNTDLAGALASALEAELQMDPPDAEAIGSVVAEAFGGQGEVMDDQLPQDLRSVFYTMEKKRWLGFRREEIKTLEGGTRRAFFWTIRWDEIQKAAEQAPARVTIQVGAGARSAEVYEELPTSAWSRISA